MKRRMLVAASAALAASALLAGCTSGAVSTAGNGSTPAASASAGSASAPATPASPHAVSLSSTSGPLVGGGTVTIGGTALSGVTRVTFDGVDAPRVSVVSSTSVKVVVPSAVDYQPSSGGVAVYAGSTPVVSTHPLTYTWSAQTGVDRQMQYAFAHWNAPRYNTAYLNFDSVGGDCQDFVSQSLLAAGLPKSSSWFYDSASSHSSSWGYAPAFNDLAPSLGFTRLSAAQESQVQVGDLAYFDWNHNGVPDHVMMVSSVSTSSTGAVTIKLVGHNLDYDYRDLQTTITKDHPGANVWFYALPPSLR